MQRLNKRQTHFPLLALIFLIFIVLSILHNERSILQILKDQQHHEQRKQLQDHHLRPYPQDSFTFVKPNLLRLPGVIDRFSKCNSTRKYSRRKIEWTAGRTDSTGTLGRRRKSTHEKCDMFSGKCVFDNTSYPLYNESGCPYMLDQLPCHKHGRDDLGYQYWRWQPHGCNLKRWNVTEMWEKLRGKSLMFVGDSLNRGQWISMVCLLQSVIPTDKKSMSPNAPLTIFRAEEYNATVEFLWAPLLVESNSDDPVNHRLDDGIICPDSVLKHSSQWEHADILVFNTYLWWRQGPVKLLSREWKPGSEGNCYSEKTPIDLESYWRSGSDLPTMRVVENVLNKLGSKVSVINITQLSEYQKDGHPSIYC